jgi:hypothetical protein
MTPVPEIIEHQDSSLGAMYRRSRTATLRAASGAARQLMGDRQPARRALRRLRIHSGYPRRGRHQAGFIERRRG